MYQPEHHREDDLGIQQALIRAHPLGLLVTNGAEGLEANAIPFVLDTVGKPRGTLKGHLARANPQWRNVVPLSEALVVFQGPEAYIAPSWYATTVETGKVVPTWNYVMVQVRGLLRVIEELGWLRAQVEALTAAQEQSRATPWQVSDAPETYVAAMLRGIVGIEIEITHMEGKWKVSQNRPEADRVGVAAGLRGDGGEAAELMARLVETAAKKGRNG